MAQAGAGPGEAVATSGPVEPDRLVVTWGKEGFQPVRYHGFDVGSFTAHTVVRPGETRLQAYRRLRKELEEIAAEEFKVKLLEYLERIKRVRAEALKQAGD